MYQKMYTRRMRKACCRSPNTGLVAIRSRQRGSERRSPEQGENGSAGCWPQKHVVVASASENENRPENILGASKAELISPKALGKTPLVATIGRGSQLLASPNSRKICQDCSQNCYEQADIGSDSLAGRHNGFVQNPDHFSERFRITTAFPETFGIFRKNSSRNIRNISRKWWVAAIFPKYLEYVGKLVPTKNEATTSSGLWPE